MASRSWGPISRVLSPVRVAPAGLTAIHLGPSLPSGSSGLPGSGIGRSLACGAKSADVLPYLALLRVGFGHRRVTVVGRALLPPVFTLTRVSRCRGPGRYGLCATLRRSITKDEAPGGYPAPCPMEPGLSSCPVTQVQAAVQPPDLLATLRILRTLSACEELFEGLLHRGCIDVGSQLRMPDPIQQHPTVHAPLDFLVQ